MGTTGQVPAVIDVFSTRADYLAQVERHTERFRYGLAEEHDAIAAKCSMQWEMRQARIGELEAERAAKTPNAGLLARLAGVAQDDDDEIQELKEFCDALEVSAQWHSQRARGQRERFGRVQHCGQEHVLVRTCACCGTVDRKPVHCGHHRLCPACRGRRVRRGRARLARSLAPAIREGAPRGWRPKMLTLTIPHSGDLSRDVDVLVQGFNRFWKLLRRHLAYERGIEQKLSWFRVLEMTTSQGGHAHIHCVVVAPYVQQSILAHLWAQCLPADYQARLPVVELETLLQKRPHEWQRQQLRDVMVTRRGMHGRPLEQVMQPVVDIREWRRRDHASDYDMALDIATEASKYLMKEAERGAGGALAFNALVGARMYEALEGHRSYHTSLGFWDLAGVMPPLDCPECGMAESLIYEVVSAKDSGAVDRGGGARHGP